MLIIVKFLLSKGSEIHPHWGALTKTVDSELLSNFGKKVAWSLRASLCFISVMFHYTFFSQIFIFFQILSSHLSRQPSTSSTGSCRHDEVPTCHHPLTDAQNIRHFCASNKSMTVCHLLVFQPKLIPFKTSAIRLSACIVLAALKESKSFIWHSFKQLKQPNLMSDNCNVWHPKWLVLIRLVQKS